MPKEITVPQALINPDGQSYIHAATSNNTRKAYQQDIRHFIAWGGLLPATPDIIVSYLVSYADKLNPRTLIRRLTAIKHWHMYQNFLDPTSHPIVRKTLKGIQNTHGQPKVKALALELQDLMTMINFLGSRGRLIDLRNSALLLIGFFGAFRRSELLAIKYEHLHFKNQGLEILIPRSKTDQTGEGQRCSIPYHKNNSKLCAVRAIKTWCERAKVSSGYVFRKLNKQNLVMQSAISAGHLNIILKTIAQDGGLNHPEKYSSHSLRRGFATVASQKGASLSAIMRQGRWRSSDTALSYVEEGRDFIDNAANVIFS